MRKKTCFVFGAGEYSGPPPQPQTGDCVIAADGGLVHIRLLGLAADLVIGDFDSLGAPPDIPGVITLPQVKNDTDMVAALREGWARGYRVFHIYAGTGGRLDHTLANLQCLADLAVRGGRGYLFDRDVVITAIDNDTLYFEAGARGTLSVFAHTQSACGVYEKGLKYTLDNATLTSTHPLGISNEFTGAQSSVGVQDGTLLVFYPAGVRERSV